MANGAYSMQDIVPWSLIYGAQNEGHQLDIRQKNEELVRERVRTHQLACIVVKNLIGSSTASFVDEESCEWKTFMSIADIVSDVDIDNVKSAYCEVIDKSYGFVSLDTHNEIDIRAQCLKKYTNAIN
jgi:hypothetical protein